MKKLLSAVAVLSLLLPTMSFAISAKDTTILGQGYAKINSCDDLGELRKSSSKGKVLNAIVMKNIDCGNKDFSPIGSSESYAYEGIFDGNGKTISGMKIGTSNSYTGMFGVIGTAGQVKNVTIAYSEVNASSEHAGILVGLNYGLVMNCTVEASCSVKSSGTDVGGVAGRNGGYGTMSGCVNKASVSGGKSVGGIAGACTGAISSSVNYGKISGTTYVGGVVGSIHYRTASTLSSNEDSTFVPGRVALCQNVGEVAGGSYAGGIAGENQDGTINNCRNDGAVSASKGTAGGVVGKTYFDGDSRYEDGKYKAVVSNSFNTASVTGGTVGGVAGKVYNDVAGVRGECIDKGLFFCHEYAYTYDSTFSRVENSYYDNQKLAGANAVGKSETSKIKNVSGKSTSNMFANTPFVTLLNSGSSYIAWLYDGSDYPVLNFGADQGNFKVTFKVNDATFYEATTVNNKMVGAVSNPSGAFKGWMDDENKMFSSVEANNRTYSRNVVYNAVFKQLFEITFVTDFGVELDKKTFEEGSQIFYSRVDDEGNVVEIPADFDTDSATFKFEKWSSELGFATKNDTITAIYTMTKKAFDVKFYAKTALVDSQRVAVYKDAVDPAEKVPSFENLRFKGWDGKLTNVTENREIQALFDSTMYLCVDSLGTKDCRDVPVDTTITIPENPSDDSITCVWTAGENVFVAGTQVKAGEIKGELTLVCTVNEFDVIFMAKAKEEDAAVEVEKQKVAYGDAAQTPAAEKVPVFDGFRFTNWIEDYSRIVKETIVNARYIPTVEVCFGAGEFDAADCDTLDKDSTYDIPELPGDVTDEDGYTCTEWTLNGESFEGTTFTASEKMEFVAKCHKNFFDVKFYVLNVMADSQRVAYGASATAPADPTAEDFRFDGWEPADFSRITADLVVNAKMTAVVEFCFAEDCKTVPVDTTIVVPEVPSNDSTDCTAWMNGDKVVKAGDELTVNANMNFEAVCSAKVYNVKFVVFQDTVKKEEVAHGASATAPADPTAEDFRFDGWEPADFSRITADLVVNAKMTAVVEFCFAEDCKTVPVDTTIVVPEVPSNDSTDCTAWMNGDKVVKAGDELTVNANMNFEAVCTVNEFDVKFVAFDTLLVDSQRVAYGSAAVEPADSLVPVFEGYRFRDWDEDDTYIVSDLVVHAIYDTLVKVVFKAEVNDVSIDSIFYVAKDTTITGINEWKTFVEQAAGDGNTCAAFIDGNPITSDSLKVSEDIDVSVKCKLEIKYITFYAFDSLLATIPVIYGFTADFDAPEFANKRFIRWDADLTKITEDMDVNAVYVDVDTVFVMVNGTAIDSIEIAKGDSVSYVLKEVKNTEDSTFLVWKVDGEEYDVGDTVMLKYGSEIFADFEKATAIRSGCIAANFSVRSENGQLQVIGARTGVMMTVLDLQGRVIVQKRIQNSVELVNIANRGNYLVRVGYETKRVVVR